MPVAQFSGDRNWGYDGVFPFAVQNSYGGPKALQHFVDACHQKGIAVMLDVVYNHVGPEGNNLEAFGPYFTDKYKTPWGKAVNFDDAGSDAVRKFFIENALMWFRDFHIDALRLDAVHAIKDFSPEHILRKIKQYTNELMWETGHTHYLIAECDLNDVKYIEPLEQHGHGMDAQWVDEFHHALRITAGNERTGYYNDFNGILHLAKAWRHGYVYDGQYSPHRDRTFGTDASNIPAERFIVFSQNHDQVGNRMLGERTSALVSFEMLKVLAASVLTSPYLPMLFMGEEYAEKNPFQYFVSHQEKELIEAVRKGRKSEFAAFHNGEDVPDPQAELTFKNSTLNWKLLDEPIHQTMFRYYQKLITIRKEFSSLSNTERSNIKIDVLQDKNCLTVHRWSIDQHVLCIFNFSKEVHELASFPEGRDWKLQLNSAAVEWGGTENHQVNSMNPESFRLYSNQDV
jgi:maltooligosyltrehalose trehalohydrolase